MQWPPNIRQDTAVIWADADFFARPGHWATATARIAAGPRAPETTGPAESGAGMRAVSTRIVQALHGWTNRAALEVRYTAPAPGRLQGIDCHLVARAEGGTPFDARAAAEQLLGTAARLLPPGFVAEPADPAELAVPAGAVTCAEVRRHEEVLAPALGDYSAAEYYYVPGRLHGDGSAWDAFLRTLLHAPSPVLVSLVFLPTVLTPRESAAHGHLCSALEYEATARTVQDYLGPVDLPPDDNARRALEAWRRFGDSSAKVLARATVVGDRATTDTVAATLAAAVGSSHDVTERGMSGGVSVVRPGDGEDLRLAAQCLAGGSIAPWGGHRVWQLPQALDSIRRVPYLFAAEEAASMLVLPVPGPDGCPGLEVSSPALEQVTPAPATDPQTPVLALGDRISGGPAATLRLPLDDLVSHALIVGAPNTGKSTTLQSLLVQLWRDHKVPWLVIEPVKTEHRGMLAVPGMEALRIHTLGDSERAPWRFNPLQPPPGTTVHAHISSLMAVFRAVVADMDGALPLILEQALEETYVRAGWNGGRTLSGRVPTLRALLPVLDALQDDSDYRGQALNVFPALATRVRALLGGEHGYMFDTVEETDWAGLLDRPAVLELASMADPAAIDMTLGFLLSQLSAFARLRGSQNRRLRHLIVLEEAHRVFARPTGGPDRRSAEAVSAFANALAELSSFGQGFVLVDQVPERLDDSATALTGVKIMHALRSEQSRQAMLGDMGAGPRSAQTAAALRRGQALVGTPRTTDPLLAAIRPDPAVDTARVVDDDAVVRHMAEPTRALSRLLPYELCCRDICQDGCVPERRERGRTLAFARRREERAEAHRAPGGEPRRGPALGDLARSMGRACAGDVADTYCAMVHVDLDKPLPGLTPQRRQSDLTAVVRRQAARTGGGAP
ncbi:ATP-binding protein [Streptomyces erythrochromogenes]|uniref:ATP-binding protein n=1 Tax=Streptomyces erythrochromogenes TaxID=285574 RepID=UPI00331664D0